MDNKTQFVVVLLLLGCVAVLYWILAGLPGLIDL
jgi:hypothetical protein